MKNLVYTLYGIMSIICYQPYIGIGQITYNDEEIMLPDGVLTPAAPRDIIRADGKTYVYTYKSILIYNDAKVFQGSIDLTSQFGRFAPMYFNGHLNAPDPKLMAHDPLNHILYFVTPNLTISSVSTSGVNTTPTSEPITINGFVDNRNLHAYSKLEYDYTHKRLFWLFRTMDDNLHSFDSYFGVFHKETSSWTPLYQEFLDGKDTVQYLSLISTFAINTHNDNFYLSRKFNIETWTLNQNSVDKINTISTPHQERNGKMLVVDSKSLLLVFPYFLGYSDFVDQFIYQISLQNSNNYDSVLAPSKRIMDAVYLSDNQDIILCYADDSLRQISTGINHDMAAYHYSTINDMFNLVQTINTRQVGELDTDQFTNLNIPFKLTPILNEKVVVSKKNEIVGVSLSSPSNYTIDTVYLARDSYFNKGVEDGSGNAFIINAVNAGLEKISCSFILDQAPIKTAYPVFNTEYNPTNRKLYFFNRLSTDNTGFYEYDLVTGTQTFVETEKAIGDLVYNAVQNHILISQFSHDDGSGAIVKVINANDLTSSQSLSWTGTEFDYNFPGRMFVAPNGKIYISMNMRADDKMPVIQIIDAADYSNLASPTSGLTTYPAKFCSTFQSSFCYNPHNEKVYATFGSYISIFQPYQTSYNSSIHPGIEHIELSVQDYGGKLISFDAQNQTLKYNIERPSEIICAAPDSMQANTEYKGTLFINSYNGLKLFDCKESTFVTPDPGINNIADMTYCSESNCLYAYYHEYVSIDNVPDEITTHIYKVHEDASFNEIWQMNGYASSVSYNRYDSQLYVYYLADEELLGQANTKVFTLDPFADTLAQTDSVSLPFKNFFPQIHPQANHPYFDAYTNKAYFPNGIHSTVSVVDFTPNEALHLTKGPNWISVPRLQNNSSASWDESDSTKYVFDAANFEFPYQTLNMLHNHTNQSGEEPYTVNWNQDVWAFYPNEEGNRSTYSYRGYILDLSPGSENQMYMSGNIKDPSTFLPLYKRKYNWLGYFLTEEQDIFDALGAATVSKLDRIRAQYFFCYTSDSTITAGPIGGHVTGTFWVCDKHQTNIKYGEMVQLRSKIFTNDSLQWQQSGLRPREKIRPEPEYFTYEELAAYTPIIIELDYNENPLEIGAFINDTCIGAEAVMPGDSVIILRAYLGGGSADDIVFQDYFGTKSSNNIIDDYMVFNNDFNFYENRLLKSNMGTEIVKVSFRKKDYESTLLESDHIKVWPNPANNALNYSIYIEKEGNTNISLYDMNAKLLAVLLDQNCMEGVVSGSIDIKSKVVNNLKPGIYLLKISTGQTIISRKLVLR